MESQSSISPVTGDFQGDDIDRLREHDRQDPEFRAAYEDADARSALIGFLANQRKKRNWSQTELAKRLKTTQSAVSDFEKSRVEPRLPTLQKWARAFGFRLELQLRPLVPFNSWKHRSLCYEDLVLAVRLDDEIARSWFTSVGESIDRQEARQRRIIVGTAGVQVDVHLREPSGDEPLAKQLVAATATTAAGR